MLGCIEQVLELLWRHPVQRCDEVLWDFLGLSMASWNTIASLLFVALWIAAAVKKKA